MIDKDAEGQCRVNMNVHDLHIIIFTHVLELFDTFWYS